MTPEGYLVGRRPIVDTHFHLWDLDENYYPWLSDGDRSSLIKDYSLLRKNYLVADLLRDIGELNVVAGVHIQAEHDHTGRGTRDALAAACGRCLAPAASHRRSSLMPISARLR